MQCHRNEVSQIYFAIQYKIARPKKLQKLQSCCDGAAYSYIALLVPRPSHTHAV